MVELEYHKNKRMLILPDGVELAIPKHIVDDWLPDQDEKIWLAKDKNSVLNTGVVLNNQLYGNIWWLRWVSGEEIHRGNNKPCLISLDPEESNYWCVNGKRHRTDGPAIYSKHYDIERYWIDDIEFEKQKFWNHPEVINHKLDSIVNENF